MELYEQIICRYFDEHKLEIIRDEIMAECDKIVEMECYKALLQIKEILEDESLTDKECFMKIEWIVSIFEKIGSNCGSRHDF
ncbi:MAG: hypothetical protein IKW68_03680 [Clostridia bacterium]|nr:hypothetical protein [Clostridia bacterium]